jgi:hypothetical protein
MRVLAIIFSKNGIFFFDRKTTAAVSVSHQSIWSNSTIAVPPGQLGLHLWRCRKPGKCSIMAAGFGGIFYTCIKQTKTPAN